MCGPLLGSAGSLVGLIGSVIQGVGAASSISNQAKDQLLAAEHQAQQYLRNARFQAQQYQRESVVTARNLITQAVIHERQARLEREKGSYDSARMTERGRQVIGAQVAAYGDSGIAIEGTIAQVVRHSGESAALDIAATRHGARVAEENQMISYRINRRNARLALRYGDQNAEAALRYGREAAADARKYGVTAAASTMSAMPFAVAAPIIAGVGTFLGSAAAGTY